MQNDNCIMNIFKQQKSQISHCLIVTEIWFSLDLVQGNSLMKSVWLHRYNYKWASVVDVSS